MKRVKLMLLSFCVLAVVAGALAFKAKGTLEYCTSVISSGTTACPTNYACPTDTKKLLANSGSFICTAATSGVIGSECTNVNCGTTSAQYAIEP